jgi:hypothetical protein
MVLDRVSHLAVGEIVGTLLAVLLACLLYARYGHGLHQFPGPFVASFSHLWRVWHVLHTSRELPMVKLHQKYGDIVRLSPNAVSFGHPNAIREIYGPQGLKQKACALELVPVHQITHFSSSGRYVFSPRSNKQGGHHSITICEP